MELHSTRLVEAKGECQLCHPNAPDATSVCPVDGTKNVNEVGQKRPRMTILVGGAWFLSEIRDMNLNLIGESL